MCSSCCTYCRIGPGLSKSAHVREVADRKTLHIRGARAQIMRQAIHYFGTPALLLLQNQNGVANGPIQPDQL